jgi:hypothetical protein
MKSFDLLDSIIAHESGESDESDDVELFAQLIRTGHAWSLQGHYGRTARAYIDGGVISETGEIL